MKNLVLGLSFLLFSLFSFKGTTQSTGSLDPTFGDDGLVMLLPNDDDNVATALKILDDGSMLIGGYTNSPIFGKNFLLVKLLEDGSLDASFGDGGMVSTDIGLGSDDVANAMALDLDGNIYLAGYSDDGANKDACIAKYLNDGSLDTSFGDEGKVVSDYDNGLADELKSVEIALLTGEIVVGGTVEITSTQSRPVMAKYAADGSLVDGFGNAGVALIDEDPFDTNHLYMIESLKIRPNGKVTAVGWKDFPGISWSADYMTIRVNSDGSLDNTFAQDGVNTYNGNFNGNDKAFDLILESDDTFKMAGAGYVNDLKYIFTGFGIQANGSVGTWTAGSEFSGIFDDAIAYDIEQDNQDRFVFAGSVGDASKDIAIVRFNENGTVDNQFGNNGQVRENFDGNTFNEVFGLGIQSDDKIVVAGYSGDAMLIARFLGEEQAQLNDFELVTPADGSSEINFSAINLNWTNAFGAENYEVEWDTSINFDANPQSETPTASIQLVNDLLSNQTYYWRVRAFAGDEEGEWSETWSFTTNGLDNFELVSPSNGAEDELIFNTILQWEDNLGSEVYEVEYDTSENFDASPILESVNDSELLLNNLTTATTYYWRVRAGDAVSFGEWSETWSFTTELGINIDESTTRGFETYPNPVTNQLFIQSEDNGNQIEVRITDLQGRLVLSTGNAHAFSSVDLSSLPKGQYFLQILSEENELLHREKLVKL